MGRDGGGDERYHGLVRRLRVRRLHRPGGQHHRSLPERDYAKSTSIHRDETSSVKAVKIKDQVKCTIKERGG